MTSKIWKAIVQVFKKDFNRVDVSKGVKVYRAGGVIRVDFDPQAIADLIQKQYVMSVNAQVEERHEVASDKYNMNRPEEEHDGCEDFFDNECK